MTRRFGVALVGTGMAALPHARALTALADDLKVVGVFSRRQTNREAFAARFGFPAAPTVEELAESADVDSVILVTPPNERGELIDLFAAAGKHILAEKPLERTPEAAEEIVATCRRRGVRLGVVFQHRFRPASRRLAELLASGRLGAIELARAEIPWWRDQGYYDEAGRGTIARDGGGVLISQAIHTLDLLLSLAGPVAQVQALAATTGLHRMETEDFAVAGLRFESGAVGSVVATTAAWPGEAESITFECDNASAVLKSGTLSIHWRDREVETFGAEAGSGAGSDPMAFPFDWHRDLITSFVERCRAGRDPEVAGDDSVAVQWLIEAMLRSSSDGVRVQLSGGRPAFAGSC